MCADRDCVWKRHRSFLRQRSEKNGGTKALIVYGGGSARRSGLLERIEKSLEEEGIAYAEFGGVKPNPGLAFAEEGVEKGIREKVDFILGVGGGSAIDTAKAIAHGVANPGIPLWDIWMKKVPLTRTTKVGVVLTIPAAGSETSDSAVLTNEVIGKKSGSRNGAEPAGLCHYESGAYLYTSEIPDRCGIADIMMHTLERYFIPDRKPDDGLRSRRDFCGPLSTVEERRFKIRRIMMP